MAFIYVITNQINGKQYVGKTNFSIERRLREHIRDSKKRRCEKRPLYAAINKYGKENFAIETLEECTADESADREMFWIKKLNTYHNGYNATLGGDSKHYYDYKDLANVYLKYGAIKKAAEKYCCSCDTIRFACKECGVYVKKTCELGLLNKPVTMINKFTDEIISEFDSISQAAEYVINKGYSNNPSAARKNISAACHNRRKSSMGFKWKFK